MHPHNILVGLLALMATSTFATPIAKEADELAEANELVEANDLVEANQPEGANELVESSHRAHWPAQECKVWVITRKEKVRIICPHWKKDANPVSYYGQPRRGYNESTDWWQDEKGFFWDANGNRIENYYYSSKTGQVWDRNNNEMVIHPYKLDQPLPTDETYPINPDPRRPEDLPVDGTPSAYCETTVEKAYSIYKIWGNNWNRTEKEVHRAIKSIGLDTYWSWNWSVRDQKRVTDPVGRDWDFYLSFRMIVGANRRINRKINRMLGINKKEHGDFKILHCP